MSDDSSSDDDRHSDVPSLASRILQASCLSVFEDPTQLFLPEGCISELVTQDAVCREIPKLRAAQKKALLEFILDKAPKIFAIAVCCRIQKDDLYMVMKKYHKHNFCDASLPLDKALQEHHPASKVFTSPFWDPFMINEFYNKQWRFLSPVFQRSDFVYNLAPDCILPFIWKGTTVKEGYSSQVLEVEIHQSHQEEPNYTIDGKPAHFAIKEIKPTKKLDLANVEKNWEAEAKALNEFNGLKHPHIITSVAALQKGENRYFIFPWADGGSLGDYWQNIKRPNLSSELVREVIQQLKGLADALVELHHYNGTENYRHGDLKPENILRFRNHRDQSRLGILKIADLGLAKRQHDLADIRPPTNTRFDTARYESPEVYTNTPRSQRYDIWSMGCIILELIVWMLYGYDQLSNLQQSIDEDCLPSKGTYFKVYALEEQARVHDTVLSWMSYMMTNDPECSQPSAIRDLLILVKTKLLVVPLSNKPKTAMDHEFDSDSGLSRRMDHSSQEIESSRANSTILLASLEEILKKTQRSAKYAFTTKPRYHIHGPSQQHSLATPDGLDDEDPISDIESVFSVFSDASISTVNSDISELGLDLGTVLNETISLMLEESVIYSRLKDAFEERKMQRARLERNLVRLLKKMSQDLKNEELESIAEAICKRVDPEALAQDNFMNPPSYKDIASQTEEKEASTRRDVAGLGKETAADAFHDDGDVSDSDPELDDHESSNPEALLQHIRSIVANSQAFESLVQGLTDFVHPSFHVIAYRIVRDEAEKKRSFEMTESIQNTLNDLVSELSYSSPIRIEESSAPRLSWVDKAQLLVEQLSNQEWLWWPLQPPEHPLRHGFTKLSNVVSIVQLLFRKV
ncbi:hypothetical protein G7054_g5510 [Neopestalotiopsis clavispora]|nr:hypothetical protein G7054_g5510 [Neopestalotiopsis clavispora]